LWEGTELVLGWLARGDGWCETAVAAYQAISERLPCNLITDVVIERPQVYTQRKQKGDPNDLITVALNAGAFAGLFYGQALIHDYRPHRWKGQIPKGVAIERFQRRLSIEERARVEEVPKTLMHNVWDAVGLGLHHIGRRQ
jgi:hypothetical protein